MDTITSSTFLYSPPLPRRPTAGTLLLRQRQPVARAAMRGGAGGGGSEFGGALVNEGMAVLRKRIHEVEMAERNYEAPVEWMEWEKRYYARYGSGVCWAVGILQAALMSTQPSVAAGMVALVVLSLPASVVMIGLHVMGMGMRLH